MPVEIKKREKKWKEILSFTPEMLNHCQPVSCYHFFYTEKPRKNFRIQIAIKLNWESNTDVINNWAALTKKMCRLLFVIIAFATSSQI